MQIQISDNRYPILSLLNHYSLHLSSIYPKKEMITSQKRVLEEFRTFISTYERCFLREPTPYGHVTGSALILNDSATHVLLTHHKKLHKWLQLGGHAEGDHFIEQVAYKEAVEESGLTDFSFLNPVTGSPFNEETPFPFDLDIHLIPANSKEPEHKHYDVRFLLQTHSREDEICISEESLDLKWIALEEVKNYTKEPSTLRQIEKALYVSQKIKKNDNYFVNFSSLHSSFCEQEA
jgi:8-oxo-dGTP pyrophosphatase MutT (NUDIX family)